MATAKQKAAARRNLVKARAARRRGFSYRGGSGPMSHFYHWLDTPGGWKNGARS